MRTRTSRWLAPLAAALLLASGAARAADPAPQGAPPDPSPETRAKMAEVHERMAACLRSDKAIAECRAEMHAGCMATMGAEGCPMMGGGGMGMGMGRGMGGPGRGMMRGGPPQPDVPPQPEAPAQK
jgi:hypothetical protein